MLNEHELLVANMRNTNDEGVANDRLFVYNLTTDEVVWEWYFKDHYPESMDGGMNEDWSHVNDVDQIEEGRFLVSPGTSTRQSSSIARPRRSRCDSARTATTRSSTSNTTPTTWNRRMGRRRYSSPTATTTASSSSNATAATPTLGLHAGTPPEECHWDEVWELGENQFNWPRDADRLPNGNTLVTDSLNHRVVEVTPEGEVVWEARTPWGPYDAERVKYGPESNGPTMRDQGVNGSFQFPGRRREQRDGRDRQHWDRGDQFPRVDPADDHRLARRGRLRRGRRRPGGSPSGSSPSGWRPGASSRSWARSPCPSAGCWRNWSTTVSGSTVG